MLTTHVRTSLMLLLAVLIGGTLGYTVIEGWSVLDWFYMTVITLSTVGYGELRPLSNLGRLFTSLLILVGVATVAYTAARSMEALIEQRLFHWRKISREIRRMQGHFVICGYGRMGEIVVGLRRHGGEMTFDPPSDVAPRAGDVLVVLGRTENLRRLELLAGRRAR